MNRQQNMEIVTRKNQKKHVSRLSRKYMTLLLTLAYDVSAVDKETIAALREVENLKYFQPPTTSNDSL